MRDTNDIDLGQYNTIQLCQICIQSCEWINLTSLAGRIRAFFQNQEIFNCILNWTCKELMWLSSSVYLFTGNLTQTKSNNHGQLKKRGSLATVDLMATDL